ncbi:hypothetical protein IU474_16805 [Nocardia otitidiscaviarum]|uniref:hypothetical protein n=1 Tax=Nocardia otitidiscaviarum TaxID=1823 RepID=UPI00189403ED|nr:hypothetical protein [Nocardia otitidiscaviarum]MBF6238711.1 hypothetical protein [Nocardia otitidiscaviarum]
MALVSSASNPNKTDARHRHTDHIPVVRYSWLAAFARKTTCRKAMDTRSDSGGRCGMPKEQRHMPQKGERRDEYAARLIVEANSCYELTAVDHNSGVRLVDYTVAPSGSEPIGVLEVGRNTTESIVRGRQAFLRYASGGYSAPDLHSSWILGCRSDTQFKPLFKRALPILMEIEAADIDQVDFRDSWRAGGFSQRLREIGVRSASVVSGGQPPARIFVTLTWGLAAPIGPKAVVDELEQWLTGESTRDLREKLSADGAAERHAFVWVDASSAYGAWRALREEALPILPPQLPPEVTHVWVTNGYAGWFWSPLGWSRLSCVEALELADSNWPLQKPPSKT